MLNQGAFDCSATLIFYTHSISALPLLLVSFVLFYKYVLLTHSALLLIYKFVLLTNFRLVAQISRLLRAMGVVIALVCGRVVRVLLLCRVVVRSRA